MSAAQIVHAARARLAAGRKARLHGELVKALRGCVDVLVRSDAEVVGRTPQCTDAEWDAALAAANAVLAKVEAA